jgi:hypothetical protein
MLRSLSLVLVLAVSPVVVASPVTDASPARAIESARPSRHPGVERWLKKFLQAGSKDRSRRLYASARTRS